MAATCGSGPLAPAVGAAVAAQVAQVDRLVDVGVPQLRQCLESAACCMPGQGLGVVLDAEVGDSLAVAAEVGDERVVGVEDEPRLAVQARPPARPSGRPAAPARRSGRAGRGTGWRAGAGAAATARRPAAARPHRPRRGRAGPAAAGVEQRRRDAPAPCSSRPGCARRAAPPRSRHAASIAAVVVLPFVAETSSDPSSSSLAMRPAVRGERAAAAGPGSGRAARCGPSATADRPREPGELACGPVIRPGRRRAGSAAPRVRWREWRRSGRRRRR